MHVKGVFAFGYWLAIGALLAACGSSSVPQTPISSTQETQATVLADPTPVRPLTPMATATAVPVWVQWISDDNVWSLMVPEHWEFISGESGFVADAYFLLVAEPETGARVEISRFDGCKESISDLAKSEDLTAPLKSSVPIEVEGLPGIEYHFGLLEEPDRIDRRFNVGPDQFILSAWFEGARTADHRNQVKQILGSFRLEPEADRESVCP